MGRKTAGQGKFRRLIGLCLVVLMLGAGIGVAPGSGGAAYAETPNLALVGKSAILIDAASGKILYEKNSETAQFPASTTKIMTAILTLEKLKLNRMITIDSETPFTKGSRIYLVEGEVASVRDVMYGMMLESANDAATALAKEISGSVPKFVEEMNRKAKELGARNTHFVNPNGLHEPEHVSTARDLALMARYAMQNPTFREYVATYKYDMAATNKQEARHFYNTNRLLYDEKHKVTVNGVERPCKYEGITGVKTGYTSDAGGCLVASAKRGNTELIAVALASTDYGRFADCITLLDYGFARFRSVDLFSAGAVVGQAKVKRGEVSRVDAEVASPVYAIVPLEASDDKVRTKLKWKEALTAPVKQGDAVGTLFVYAGDELCGEFPVVAGKTIAQGGILSVVGIPDTVARTVRNLFLVLLGLAIGGLLLYIVLKRRQIKRRRLKRRRGQTQTVRFDQRVSSFEAPRRRSDRFHR